MNIDRYIKRKSITNRDMKISHKDVCSHRCFLRPHTREFQEPPHNGGAGRIIVPNICRKSIIAILDAIYCIIKIIGDFFRKAMQWFRIEHCIVQFFPSETADTKEVEGRVAHRRVAHHFMVGLLKYRNPIDGQGHLIFPRIPSIT